MFQEIASKTSVLFIVLLIGAAARYKKILDEASTRTLANLVLVVALPFLYFHSLSTKFTAELLNTIWVLPVFALALVSLGYAIAKVLSGFIDLPASSKATFVYLATFTNCGFLAIPIANALYGPDGIIRVVFFNVGFNLLYWTLGVRTLRTANKSSGSSYGGRFALAGNLINGGTIGLLCGIGVGLMSIRLPSFLMDSANIIGSATIPLALLVVGSIMSKCDMSKFRQYRRSVILITVCRLLVVPCLALFISSLFKDLAPLSRAIIVLQSAMPSASTTPIFVSRFGGDMELASVGVFATTMCSIITVPFFISLL
ncbi:MAG: AEC family transporter [Candidatus Omnitrophica bacterium]|nr:AEC family transporter [Candidatus Omnitrophota bacterium]